MKKYSRRLVPYLKMVKRRVKNFFEKFVSFISYPQYSLFVIEILFFGGLIWYSIILALPTFKSEVIEQIFNFGVIKQIFNLGVIKIIFNYLVLKLNFNIYKLYCLVGGLIIAVTKFYLQRGINYGGINEQLNDAEGRGEVLKNSIPKILKYYHIYFLLLAFILIFCNVLSIGKAFINDIGIIFALILYVCELFLNIFTFSPYLFIIFVIGLPTIVNSIGKESVFLNWTFLAFVFATFIGSNFFDKSLVNKRFSKELTKENLILRKISFFIGLTFLYIGILSSDFVINSTLFYLFDHYVKSIIGSVPSMRFIVKGLTFIFVFIIYLGTEKKIVYVIFKFYYRDMKLEFPSKLVEVYMDKKIWRLGEKNILPFHLKNLKRIGLDTYQIEKDKNRYYVNQKSEIPNKIKGSYKNDGRHILGVVNFGTKFCIFIMLVILLSVYFLDKQVSVDDGVYKGVVKSDKKDSSDISSDIIEISGDTIIYNGKAEKFDTRKQSFSMGEIKKNDNDNITVKFYITGKEVQYKKRFK